VADLERIEAVAGARGTAVMTYGKAVAVAVAVALGD
jgi:hypothetical protein